MAGKIQNADIKTEAELIALGATKTELPNTTKVYSPKTTNVLETDLRKNNDVATTDPAVGNDSSQNYEPGSRWLNTTSGELYVCMSNATGAAVWKEQVGATATQILTNKTLTSPVLNSPSVVTPSRLDAKPDTYANLVTYASTATDGQFCFATDTKVMYQVINGLLADVGSGGGVGSLDVLSSDSADKAVLADYTQTNLEIVSTPIVLHGTKSFRLQHTTSIKSFKKVIAVDKKFRGKNNTVTLDVLSTATSGNLNILFYDETNAANLVASQSIATNSLPLTATTANASNQLTGLTQAFYNTLKVGMVITGSAIPVGTTITALAPSTLTATISQNATGVSTGIRISDLVQKKTFSFDVPNNCLSLSWTISSVVEAAVESYIDDVVVQLTAQALSSTSITVPVNNNYSGLIVSGMTIGATTTAPTKGTIVTDKIVHSRFENRLKASFQFNQSAGGTAGSGDYLFTLPNSLSFDSNQITPYAGAGWSGNNGIVSAYVGSADVTYGGIYMGIGKAFAYSSTQFRIYIETTTTAGGGALGYLLGSSNFPLSGAAAINAEIDAPIAGWSSNQTTTTTIPLTTAQLVQQSDSTLKLSTNNGYGSTNTKIRRFVNIDKNIGSSISYQDSATFGASFTVLEAGEFQITYYDNFTSAQGMGLTVNSAELTTVIDSVLTTSRLANITTQGAGSPGNVSWSGYLEVGDVVRVHTSGVATTTAANSGFTISKQGSLKQLNPSSDSKITIPTHSLRFEGCSTRGSTDTAIVKFDTQTITQGDAWSVVNTAANGTVVTMLKAGKLTVSSTVYLATTGYTFITKNQAILTANPVTSEIVASTYGNANQVYNASGTVDVVVGDKIRIATNVTPTSDFGNRLTFSLTETSIPANFSNVLPQWSQSDSSIRLDTGNGTGSTNTQVRRFASNPDNLGTAISYTDSATLGASFTINEDGDYTISYTDTTTALAAIQLVKNQTTNAVGTNILNVSSIQAGVTGHVSANPYLVKGDVIRAVVNNIASFDSVSTSAKFTISKVGKPNLTSVDVTPFVNMKTTDVEAITYFGAQSGLTDRSGEIQFPIGSVQRTNNGIISVVDDTASTRTKFTALKKTIINVSFSCSASTATTFPIISKNGVEVLQGSMAGVTSNRETVSGSISLEVGDFITVGTNNAVENSATTLDLLITATADNNATASPTQQVSSDTMNFAFKATAIDPAVDAVGTFNTYAFTANSSTPTITASNQSTQTSSSMNINGVQLFSRAFNANSVAGQPVRFEIFIGKGLKSNQVDMYAAASKTNSFSYNRMIRTLSSEGGTEVSYSETSGILVLDAATSAIANTGRTLDAVGFVPTSGYFVFNASKSPSLVTIPNLTQRIAYLSDVKANTTAAGTAFATVYGTRTLNTLVDNTGIVTSLAANQFTLNKGVYNIDATCQAYLANAHRARIRNITDGTTILLGSSEYANGSTQNTSRVNGEITITSSKTFELQHFTTTATATNGLGVPASSGESEVYATCKITKIRD
jgi:hypothetical protein